MCVGMYGVYIYNFVFEMYVNIARARSNSNKRKGRGGKMGDLIRKRGETINY